MLLLLLTPGCLHGFAAPSDVSRAMTTRSELQVEVLARVVGQGSPAAWSATASTEPADDTRLLPGECIPARQRLPTAIPANVRSLGLDGPLVAPLLPASGTWRTASGLGGADPAWSVADLVWSNGDALGQRRLARAVQFGPSPAVWDVAADSAGVAVKWDPLSVERGSLEVTTSAGDLRCGVGRGGVVLPRWVVPSTPEVRLRSVHEGIAEASPGLTMRVRAVIERVVPFDRPPDEVAPSELPPAPLQPPPLPSPGGDVEDPIYG